jgi:hypothetical protein
MSCAPAAARCAVRAWVRDADGEGRGRNGKPRTCKADIWRCCDTIRYGEKIIYNIDKIRWVNLLLRAVSGENKTALSPTTVNELRFTTLPRLRRAEDPPTTVHAAMVPASRSSKCVPDSFNSLRELPPPHCCARRSSSTLVPSCPKQGRRPPPC